MIKVRAESGDLAAQIAAIALAHKFSKIAQ
jgi:hypothetical protein